MSRFVENAVKLLDTAENARASGHSVSEMTILISAAGGIRMVLDSDWALDTLQAEHGAATVYRVSGRDARVRIEGREGGKTCRFESEDAGRAARIILGGGYVNHSRFTCQETPKRSLTQAN